jgi:parallel beta-helix repeat protein
LPSTLLFIDNKAGGISLTNSTEIILPSCNITCYNSSEGPGMIIENLEKLTILSNITCTKNLGGGLYLTNITELTITGELLLERNAYNGLYIVEIGKWSIKNNIAAYNNYLSGIYLERISNVTLSDFVSNDNGRDGVVFYNVSNILLENFTAIENSRTSVSLERAFNVTIVNATLGYTYSLVVAGGIEICTPSANITIINTTISKGNGILSGGIYVSKAGEGYVENLTIKDCELISNKYNGIWLTYTRNAIITNTNMTGSTFSGIAIWGNSRDIGIANCSISGNTLQGVYGGIYIRNANNTTIEFCNITSNEQGIYLDSSEYITIKNSNISFNNLTGIYVYNSAYNTIINSNISFNNGTNINLTTSNYNLIYNNNFFTSGDYKNQSYDNGINLWNSSDKGNFWSDYEQRYPKATNDGEVWSIAYEIEGKDPPNLDEYPLVSPPM